MIEFDPKPFLGWLVGLVCLALFCAWCVAGFFFAVWLKDYWGIDGGWSLVIAAVAWILASALLWGFVPREWRAEWSKASSK